MDLTTKLDEWASFAPDYEATEPERSELLRLAGDRSNKTASDTVWRDLTNALKAHSKLSEKEIARAVEHAQIAAILGAVPRNAEHLVELWTTANRITCRYNGMIDSGVPTMVLDNGKVVELDDTALADPEVVKRTKLTRRDTTAVTLQQNVYLFCRRWPSLRRFAERELDSAVAAWVDAARAGRAAVLFREVDAPLDAVTAADVETKFLDFIRRSFVISEETPAAFYAAVLRKFMHQVKGKMLGLEIKDHLMPVLLGPQGVGKTTLVGRMCAPLQEAMRTVKFDQLAMDQYALEMSRSFIVFIDEMAGARKAEMSKVKTMLTATRTDTRPLGKNAIVSVEEKSTFIGTSNEDMDQLIRDKTGNRRFIGIEMVAKPDWASLDAVDWRTVWSSVDAYGADPLKAYDHILKTQQDGQRSRTNTELWLQQFDPTESTFAELIRLSPHGGYVFAADLHKVFHGWEMVHCGRQFATDITVWSRQMGELLNRYPIFDKKMKGKGRLTAYKYVGDHEGTHHSADVVPLQQLEGPLAVGPTAATLAAMAR